MIFVPAASHASAVEMVAIDPRDLQDAQDRDAELRRTAPAGAQSESEKSRDKN